VTPPPRAWARHALRLLVGLALLGLVVWLGGTDDIGAIATARPGPIALALLATILINIAAGLRWGVLANALGGRRVAGAGDYIYYTIMARVFGYLLPRDVAEIGSRTLALKRHQLPASRGIASALLDRLFDVMVLGTGLAAALPFWFGWIERSTAIWLLAAAPVAVGVLLALVWRPVLAVPIGAMNLVIGVIYWPRRFRSRRPPPLSTTGLCRRDVLTGYGLGLIKFAASAGRMTLFAWALDLSIDPALLWLATPIGQLGYVVAFTPGGLGIFDGGWFAILRAGGVSAGQATALVVGMRILTLLMLVVIAGAAHLTRVALAAYSNERATAATFTEGGD
jgi:uncharacterized membrane protein YbhN (UPF0104 family)